MSARTQRRAKRQYLHTARKFSGHVVSAKARTLGYIDLGESPREKRGLESEIRALYVAEVSRHRRKRIGSVNRVHCGGILWIKPEHPSASGLQGPKRLKRLKRLNRCGLRPNRGCSHPKKCHRNQSLKGRNNVALMGSGPPNLFAGSGFLER